MDNNTPPTGCKFIAIIILLFFIFCAGYGFYKLFDKAYDALIQ